MRPNTCLVIDCWEGQLEIDETVLKANGVAGIGIRLNNMSGGHHMDTGFLAQWEQSKNFVRFPYFVYNPWVDGATNFAWLKAHMPLDARSVAIDIEVRYSGITPVKYAGEVVKFLALCKPLWKTIIYTAEWFLSDLASWPSVDYWWAQYPDGAHYFGGVTTWDSLKQHLDYLDKPFNLSRIPGTLKMWQFSGDYLTLPGSIRKMDVNIFYGTEVELANYFGTSIPVPIPDPIDPPPVVVPPTPTPIRIGIVVIPSVNIRNGPGTVFSIGGVLKYDNKVTIYSEQLDAFGNRWGKMWGGWWVCMQYQGKVYVRYTNDVPVILPPVTPAPLPNVGFISAFIVPAVGSFYQVKHDYERADLEYKPRTIAMNYKGMLPETVILKNKKEQFHPLSEAWQRWWMELLHLASNHEFTDADYVARWENLTADSRAFTDNHAVQNGYHDYITGKGVSNIPIMLKSLTTGGNLVKVLVVNGTLLTIECLDVSKAPPPVGDVWLKKPWLYQWAGQCGPVKLSNGTYRTSPFPQLAPIYGTPVPVVSSDGSGTQVIDKALVKPLINGRTYSIYNN